MLTSIRKVFFYIMCLSDRDKMYFLLLLLYHFMSMSVLPACMSVHRIGVCCPQRWEQFLRLALSDGCEPLWRCREQSRSSLKKQPVLLTAEPLSVPRNRLSQPMSTVMAVVHMVWSSHRNEIKLILLCIYCGMCGSSENMWRHSVLIQWKIQ